VTSETGGPNQSLFVARALADADSLAGHLMAGDAGLELAMLPRDPGVAHGAPIAAGPDPGGAPSEANPLRHLGSARLGSDAFGVSGPEAAEKLARVLGGEGCFVTTGHQPILFLGPLYVLYKAVTAIELAAFLERTWKVPVLPLFWVASDDHDWEEVGSTALLDDKHQVVGLSVQVPDGADHRPVGPTPLGGDVDALLDKVDQLLVPSPFKDDRIMSIRDAYGAGNTFSSAFTDLLRAVLGDRGYAWLDSAGTAVKRAAVPLYERMMQDPDKILAAQAAGAAGVEGAGFAPPIGGLADALPLFVDSGEGRSRLFVAEGGARAGREGDVKPLEAWRARLETEPEAFSPNVSSRPVLESYLLPVAATVLGPGEIAYWSQLPPLFRVLETPFPWIQPRAAWSIVEPNVRRPLDRLGLELETLVDGGEAAIQALTAASRPAPVDAGIERLRETLEEALAELEAAIGEVLPGLKGAAGKTRKGIFDAVGKLERQVNQQTRGRLEMEIAQVRRCAANLFPGRKPQERILSPFPYLTRYGPRLVDEVAEETARWIADLLASPAGNG